MLKKLIKYVDYNGVERQENFYFNLNKAELMEMETEVTGGMRQLLESIMEKQDMLISHRERKSISTACSVRPPQPSSSPMLF